MSLTGLVVLIVVATVVNAVVFAWCEMRNREIARANNARLNKVINGK